MINHKFYWNQGAEAYRDGKEEGNNPYNTWESSELELHQAWQHGFREEKEYWEQAGISAEQAFDRSME